MALSYPKRGYAGAAVAGTLAAPGLSSSAGAGTTFTSSTTLTGWTDVTGGTFSGANLVISFGYGTATEEKILCTFNTGTQVFTVVTRGYDGTAAQTWGASSTFILVASATELAEANAAVQVLSTILNNAGTTTAPQPIAYSATVNGSTGAGKLPAAIDHAHNISASTLNSWLVAGASGTVASGVAIPYAQVTGTPTIPTAAWNKVATGTFPTTLGNITGFSTTLSGFTKYAVTVTSRVLNSGAATQTCNLQIAYNTGGANTTVGQLISLPAAATGYVTLNTTAFITGLTAGTTYTFQIVGNIGGSTTGQISGEILVTGLA